MQEYQIGYTHFLKRMKHIIISQVRHFHCCVASRNVVLNPTIVMTDTRLQGSMPSAFTDQETPKSLGCPAYEGRVEPMR